MSLNTFDKTQTQYERRMARQRQLDAMEAAASGNQSPYTDSPPGGVGSADQSLQNSIHSHASSQIAPPEAMENARRFLWDEDDSASDMNSAAYGNLVAGSGSGEDTGGGGGGGFFSRMFGGGKRDATSNKKNLAPARQSWMHDAQPSGESEEYIKSRGNGGGSSNPISAIGDCCLGTFHTLIGACAIISEQISACIGGLNPKVIMCVCFGTCGLALFVFGIVALLHRFTGASASSGSIINEQRYQDIRQNVLDSSFTAVGHLDTQGTAQNLALRWLTDYDGAHLETDDDAILQRYALAVFYFSTYLNAELRDQDDAGDRGGASDGWKDMTYWMTEKGICLWNGVSCPPHLHEGQEEMHYNENSNVVRLNLTANNVQGTLPSELVALENLESLDLSKNGLTGTIPSSIADLKLLKELYLQDNELDGTLATEFGRLGQLRDLFLGTNGLRGSIPTQLGDLTELRALGLDENFLDGTIPEQVYKLRNLMILYLDSNDLTGTISPSLVNLKEMIDLRLRKNFLKGTIPSEMGDLTKLELFYLDDNALTGTIPDTWQTLTHVQEIQLYKNKLKGPLPASFASLKDLKVLYLDNNQLSGTIPVTYGALGDLTTFYLFNNKLNGTLPAEVGQMEDLKDFQLYNNDFSGPLPASLGNNFRLEKLEFQENGFTGTIPTNLGQLESLSMLKAYKNKLTGAVPGIVCALTDAHDLSFFATDCNVDKGGTIECACCTSCYP
uniref:L domain-like protein n=1 Tax=Grammatophora oceanica TaxID=210454 RepID=A0A7S1UXP7_9STRA|mmetsp:Transcript_28550/g.42013  ORF Transcript_28550/g.42013 Transcript_28550/m.42013 type:complete len:729 (+) Transcript_28550:281-2467(+)|eukprot:CAMPEP_0194035784 /NCGR_PEP_ID=MMETSP0009_2-20130614/8205_1 /TAXON_ID=210454 /ORGANISM="Grammatophora oceanica, Strain CCMP 410" /LENGTH=728 /DNA_ID=CAMNT_0038677285 /DNA_START=274 /DNA_END=2460 /DNA_ORIENTATION=+